MSDSSVKLYNSQAAELAKMPAISLLDFRREVIDAVNGGARLSSLFAMPLGGSFELVAVLANDRQGTLDALRAAVGASYPSITPDCTQAHLFEREIAEQWGIIPLGHPWLKPVRFHRSYSGSDAWHRPDSEPILPSTMDFFTVGGEETHEVAVGPVHAGIIEPGHFRFQCHGEEVLNLEISLGYQHRGVEPALVGGPGKRTMHYIETLAGDTTIGHMTAYCQLMEGLAASPVPPRAQSIRGIALELERLANHTGDLGALAGDIGYLPTASFCGRLRGDFLNMTAIICGNRFGRGMVIPGGVEYDLEPQRVDELDCRLKKAMKDVATAVELLWQKPSVMARFEETGQVSFETCMELGLVGPPARACGLERDVRFDFPAGIYRFTQIPVSTWHTGDVFARANVRWLEIQRSVEFIRGQLQTLPKGGLKVGIKTPEPLRLVASLVEGWRGEICHVAVTDENGKFTRYKVVDPSFHNWSGLAMAMRNGQVSDFPLCNKSFNLSYCGHDL
jgi:Ni,Fe-hydrogenase III large subunit